MTTMTMTMTTDYAMAANGSDGIGSGYDCEVLREPSGAVLVCMRDLAAGVETLIEWATASDGERRSVQSLARELASSPSIAFAGGDDIAWANTDGEGTVPWDDLATRWDAASPA